MSCNDSCKNDWTIIFAVSVEAVVSWVSDSRSCVLAGMVDINDNRKQKFVHVVDRTSWNLIDISLSQAWEHYWTCHTQCLPTYRLMCFGLLVLTLHWKSHLHLRYIILKILSVIFLTDVRQSTAELSTLRRLNMVCNCITHLRSLTVIFSCIFARVVSSRSWVVCDVIV